MEPPISVADLLRAFGLLRPASDAEKQAIAEALGFDWKPARRTVAAPPERREAAPQESVETSAARPAPPPPQPSVPLAPWADEEVGLSIIGPASQDAPSLLWAKPSRDFETPSGPRVAALIAPLFTPRWTRSILSTALAVRDNVGQPDIGKIVARIARGELLRELPRLEAAAMAQRVEILMDLGESMLPFAEDQRDLVQSVVSVAGFDNVRVLKFRGTPLRGAGSDDMDDWPDSYTFPASNTHLLLLSDLGIGRLPVGAMSAPVEEWTQFGSALRKRGIACTAFVPYPSKRWPRALAAQFRIVEWDRATTTGTVRFSRKAVAS